MPGIGHIGLGLAAKRIAPKAPLGVLLVATEATDILAGAVALTGAHDSWSHSLFTSVILASGATLLAARRYRDLRTGTIVGLVVLSHWMLDFIAWKDTLPLLFGGSPQVGLGLYNGAHNMSEIRPGPAVWAMELGLPLAELAIYLHTRGVFSKTRMWLQGSRP